MARIETYKKDTQITVNDKLIGSNYGGFDNQGRPVFTTANFVVGDLLTFFQENINFEGASIQTISEDLNKIKTYYTYDENGNITGLSTAGVSLIVNSSVSDSYATASFQTNVESSVLTFNEDGSIATLSQSFANLVMQTENTTDYAQAQALSTLTSQFGTYDPVTNTFTFSSTASYFEQVKTYADNDKASAQALTTLTSQFGTYNPETNTFTFSSTANYFEQVKTYADNDKASAQALTTLTSQFGTYDSNTNTFTFSSTANYFEEVKTYADTNSAAASKVESIGAVFGGFTGNDFNISEAKITEELNTYTGLNFSNSTYFQNIESDIASRPFVYRQDDAPSTDNPVGSIWYDTNDENKVYVLVAGDPKVWTITDDSRIGASASKITSMAASFGSFSGNDFTLNNTDSAYWNAVKLYADTNSASAQKIENLGAELVTYNNDNTVQEISLSANFTSAIDTFVSDINNSALASKVEGLRVDIEGVDGTGGLTSSVTSNQEAIAVRPFIFRQDEIPSVDNPIGSLWFDTNDSNKSYVLTQGTPNVWTETRDEALISLASSKPFIFRQNEQPATTNPEGSLWYDTDEGNKLYVLISETWTSTQDADIATAQFTADGRPKVFRQDEAPATTEPEFSIWFDTDENNLSYVLIGDGLDPETFTWTQTIDGRVTDLLDFTEARYALTTDAAGVVTGMELYSASGPNTTISEVKFTADRFVIKSSTIEATPFILDVDSLKLNVPLNGVSGSFSGDISAASGTFGDVVINSDGITATNFGIDASGNVTLAGTLTGSTGVFGPVTINGSGISSTNFSIDASGNVTVSGDITGSNGEFSGSLNINDKFLVTSAGAVQVYAGAGATLGDSARFEILDDSGNSKYRLYGGGINFNAWAGGSNAFNSVDALGGGSLFFSDVAHVYAGNGTTTTTNHGFTINVNGGSRKMFIKATELRIDPAAADPTNHTTVINGDLEVVGNVSFATTTTGDVTVSNLETRLGQIDSDIQIGADNTVDVTFPGNVQVNGILKGPATFTIDPSAYGDATGKVVILGDLQVDGTTTTINSTVITVNDKILTLSNGAADSTAANDSGIEIAGALASFKYFHDGTKWVSNKDIEATNFLGNASTATNLATARDISLSGAVTGTASFDGSANITITTSVNHNHDDRYYTETESDARFVNITGDTLTGDLNFNSEVKSRYYAAGLADANDRYEILGLGNTLMLRYWDNDQGNGTSINRPLMHLEWGGASDNSMVLYGDLILRNEMSVDPEVDVKILDMDVAGGAVNLTNVTNGTFLGALSAASITANNTLTVGSTNVYNALPTGVAFTTTDNRFKLQVTTNGGATAETTIAPLLLSDVLTEGYVPFVGTGDGGGATVNSRVSNSWLKLNGDVLELGNIADPVNVDAKSIKLSRQIGPGDKQVSELKAEGFFVTSTTATFGTKNSSLQFFTNGRLNVNGAFTLPEGDGTSGQVLSTNGSGDLSWTSVNLTETDTLQSVTDRGASTTNAITITSDSSLINLRSASNGVGATINFSDHQAGAYLQNGTLRYVHSDTASYGSGNAFILESTESTMTFLADGKLMFKEGIYSKPPTGTGAGTRKDLNWDTAYGWGNHADQGYLTSYTETDTLDSVTNRGATTTNSITVGGITSNGNIVAEDAEVHIGDVSGDNWTRILHSADGYGFDFPHDNATVIVNEQGTTNEALILGDVDANNAYSGLLGVSHTSDGGTTWVKKLDLRGDGELWIGSSANERVFTSAGGTIGGTITAAGGINMNNTNLTGVNNIVINDAGAGEGIEWAGGNLWKIYESPNGLTNAAGNLQFVTDVTRRMTLDTSGNLEVTGTISGNGSGLTSVNADTVDGLQASQFLRSDADDTATGMITINSTGGGVLRLQNNDTSNTIDQTLGSIVWNNQDGSGTGPNNAAIIEAQTAGSLGQGANLLFKTVLATTEGGDATTTMTLLSTGNVGIGTTSPAEKLAIIGPDSSSYTISWQNQNRTKGNLYSDGGGVAIQAGANFNDSAIYLIPNSALDFRLNGSTRMYVNSSGNVGIGTTSPSEKLEVAGNVLASIYKTGVGAVGNYFNSLQLRTVAGGNIELGGDGPSSVQNDVIIPNGSLGIGTTSTRYQLDLAKPQDTSQSDYIALGVYNGPSGGGGTTLGSGIIWKANYSGYTKRSAGIVQIAESNYFQSGLAFYTNGTADTSTDWVQRMYLSAGGILQMNRTNGQPTIKGSTTTGASHLIIDSASGGDAVFLQNYNSGNVYMVTGGGRVGIGTTSPAAKLDVVGDTYVRSGSFFTDHIKPYSGNQLTILNGGSNYLYVNGNVGIGTTTPVSNLEVQGAAPFITITDTTETDCGILFRDLQAGYSQAAAIKFSSADNKLRFNNNDGDAVRMTIGTDGFVGINNDNPGHQLDITGNARISTNLGINQAAESTVGLAITGNGSGQLAFRVYGGGFASAGEIRIPGNASGVIVTNNGVSGQTAFGFNFGTGAGSNVGRIAINSTSTSYVTTSDYRLKENLTEITDGIERLKQLKPKRFNFIGHEQIVDGFVAHEAQAVVPEAVTGVKDGVDYNGEPEYQGIDQAKLVPLLTAALQEAVAKIEALEQRILTLENK